jgi:hypothetical protein
VYDHKTNKYFACPNKDCNSAKTKSVKTVGLSKCDICRDDVILTEQIIITVTLNQSFYYYYFLYVINIYHLAAYA